MATDQTLENATGVGSPPWTWSRAERLTDIGHKAGYPFVTGAVADRLGGLPPDRDRTGTARGPR